MHFYHVEYCGLALRVNADIIIDAALLYSCSVIGGFKQSCGPSVCLSHALSSEMVHFRAMVTLELSGQRSCTCGHYSATRSAKNGNEAIAGATAEEFARWLNHGHSLSNYNVRGIRF